MGAQVTRPASLSKSPMPPTNHLLRKQTLQSPGLGSEQSYFKQSNAFEQSRMAMTGMGESKNQK